MNKHKKNNIIYKSVGFIVFISVIIMAIILISNVKMSGINIISNDKSYMIGDIGYETFENIKINKIKVACNDAKKLSELFMQINSELSENDNLTDENISTYAISTEAKQAVDNFNKSFINFLNSYYGEEKRKEAQSVLKAINIDIYSNIVQISLMINTGNISKQEYYDYINIEYCGVKAPESYISPKDIVLYNINTNNGRSVIDNINDNMVE